MDELGQRYRKKIRSLINDLNKELKFIYKQLDDIEEKINLLTFEVDKINNQEYDKLLYEFYRDVILDSEGDLHFLAGDKRVNNFFSKILRDFAEDYITDKKIRKNEG